MDEIRANAFAPSETQRFDAEVTFFICIIKKNKELLN